MSLATAPPLPMPAPSMRLEARKPKRARAASTPSARERRNWLDARRKRRRRRSPRSANARPRPKPSAKGWPTRPTRSTPSAARLLSQLAEAESLRKAAGDRLQEAENQQPSWTRPRPSAIQSLAEARETRGRAEERLTAADERRLRGRGAHPGDAEHAAASGHPPHRPGGRQPDAGDRPRSSVSSTG